MAVAAVTGDHRRGKTALFLAACGCAGAAPHWLDPMRSLLPALTLALVLGGYGLRTVLRARGPAGSADAATAESSEALEAWPSVDVVVGARDEEAVVARLVERLAALRYPAEKLTFWVVDDGSQDRTGPILDALKAEHPQLRVLHRPRGAGGGKSGALNTVLQQLRGDWLLVLDADAQLQEDVLERLLPYAVQGGMGGGAAAQGGGECGPEPAHPGAGDGDGPGCLDPAGATARWGGDGAARQRSAVAAPQP